MANNEHYISQPSYDINDPQTRRQQRGDSFSGRFSGVGVHADHPTTSNAGMAMHPAALQTGSAIYLPPSTQLREHNVNRLLNADSRSNNAYYGAGNDGNPFNDETATITPFDSISNIDDREDVQSTAVYGGENYLARDPYDRQQPAYSKSYNTRPRSGSAGEGYDPRDSNGSLPLMANAVNPAGGQLGGPSSRSGTPSYYPDSIIDGDTVIDARTRSKSNSQQQYPGRTLTYDEEQRGILSESYPPPPPIYDGPDEEEKAEFADPSGRGARSSKIDSLTSTLKEKSKKGKRPNVWLRQIIDTTPIEDKEKYHRAGKGTQNHGYASWAIAVILVIVFIVELAKSAQKTGKAISTSPFNYMIGPSSEMLINLGARFTACMRNIPDITNAPFRCLNDTSSSSSTITTTCTLEEVCGFGGFNDASRVPNQTFRFFTALWLHVGVVHLLLNGAVLLFSSALVEKQIGTLRFLILYNISGVFGFILGGNFALTGLASMGASGAIFGTHAAILVDLIWHWRLFPRPKRTLFGLILEIIVGFGLGYIPGIDNFSHIGGFAIGLLLSIVLVPAIHSGANHKKKIAIYVARCLALIGACVMFGVLLNNFFQSDPNSACEWCRYLSCWPTASNNRCKGTGLTMTESTTSTSTPTDGTIGATTNSNVALAVVSLLSILVTRSQYKGRA